MTASPGIVWLASFPKSGNTWFRIFLANLSAGESGPADINELDERGGISSSRYEFEAATMLDSGLMLPDEIDGLRPRVYEAIVPDPDRQRWIKTHDAYTLTQDGEPLLGRGVARAAIYLVRDPRDVVLSLAHHNSTTVDQAVKLMNSASGELSHSRKGVTPQLRQKLLGWSGHVSSWLDQKDVPVYCVRYENLVAEPEKFFAAALAFAGREADRAQIDRAIRYADFAELRRQEEEKGFDERVSRTAPFFRSGRIGEWRERLTPEQIRAIEECHRGIMERLGYATS